MNPLGESGGAPIQCSRAGCVEPAVWAVNWRNPRLHTPDRVKVWLACEEHRVTLVEYLTTRGFPVAVTAAGVPVAMVP